MLAPPPIPLERESPKDFVMGTYVTMKLYLAMKLRSVPTDTNSQTYELNIVRFCNGTPEQFLEFYQDLEKTITGQKITTSEGKYARGCCLLAGEALEGFDQNVTYTGNETVETLKEVINRLTSHMFPQRALRLQKRYMRQHSV